MKSWKLIRDWRNQEPRQRDQNHAILLSAFRCVASYLHSQAIVRVHQKTMTIPFNFYANILLVNRNLTGRFAAFYFKIAISAQSEYILQDLGRQA